MWIYEKPERDTPAFAGCLICCGFFYGQPRTRYRIRLAFEELAQQILKDVLKQTALLFTIEYSQKDEKTEITAVYGGGRFDPADSDNSLSHSLLKGSVEELSYQYDQQEEKPNIVRIIIRE